MYIIEIAKVIKSCFMGLGQAGHFRAGQFQKCYDDSIGSYLVYTLIKARFYFVFTNTNNPLSMLYKELLQCL